MVWRGLVTRRVDRVIVPSHYLKEEAVRNGIAAEKLEVIQLFTEKNSRGEYFEPEGNSILFVGRADPSKGIFELIKALSLIRGHEWKADIIGTTGLIEYEKMVEDLGIRNRITFVGKLDYGDLDEYYKKASVVIFPSMSPEAFGLVGIEAMSFARPVVAFDVGGPREWLKKGETGFLVERGDIETLAFSIRTLLEDKAMAKRMGKKGMNLVNMNYRRGFHMNKIMKVYDEMIKKKNKI